MPELQAYSPDATVTVRARASAVRKAGADHSLVIVDAIVVDDEDISSESLARRRALVDPLIKSLQAEIPSFSRLRLEQISQYPVTTGTHLIPLQFLRDSFFAMCKNRMEGIVVKLTALTYGSPHTVLKPIYYGTLTPTFPQQIAPSLPVFLENYKCYAKVVYMGYRAVPRDPFLEPIFGVKSKESYPTNHPWHGYAPVHVEGFKTAYSMARVSIVNSLNHKDTAAMTLGVEEVPHVSFHLHIINSFTPKFYMVAEAAYSRIAKDGVCKVPIRLYLPRLLATRPKNVDTLEEFNRRLGPQALPLTPTEIDTAVENV